MRCCRFAVFIATLWLLSRWWRGDLTFVRYTVRVLAVFLLTVLAGLVVSPGEAMWGSSGRLVGVLWPMPAPQVGQYGAVLAGLAILLWLARVTDWISGLLLSTGSIAAMLLSHTRTATVALIIGLACGCLALFTQNSRVRRAMTVTITIGGSSALLFWTAFEQWFARGQDPDQLQDLTGRQTAWNALLAEKRSLIEQFLGRGLSDKSFNGVAIDSSWLAVYSEQGLIGVAIVAAIVVTLLGAAIIRLPSPARACAVFLIVFCAVSSYTEVGLGDASDYLLYLAVAGSLLAQKGVAHDRIEISPVGRSVR